MKQNNYSIRPYWDARAMDVATQLSRIMLTVNLPDCLQFRITLKLRSTKLEFDKAILSTSKNLSVEAKSVQKDLNDYILKAELIMQRLAKPSKEVFTRMFKSDTDLYVNNKTPIEFYFKYKISKFFSEERYGSSISYSGALTSFKKYKGNINFEDIDIDFLNSYRAWMVGMGNSVSTSQIYLRNLKCMFNEVIRDSVIAERFYPFKRFKFQPTSKSVAVLYPAQLKALLNYECDNDRDRRAIDFFFFCYTCNGLNFHDAGLLKYKNIQGDYLTFVRTKTKKTGKEIRLYIHDLTREIILKWGNKSMGADDYLFGLVNDKMSPFLINKKLAAVKRLSNKSLSRIGKSLGFDIHLCLNLARHSFATTCKINNVSVASISEALGHSNTTVTEHYMKSLPNENLKIMSQNLLSF